MKNLSIARRYAKALLLIGQEDGKADAYGKELEIVAGVIKDSELGQVLSNPLYDTVARKNILNGLIKRLKLSKVMRAFLLLLFDKGRVGFIVPIAQFYNKLADEAKGVAQASLVSATVLSSETIKKIQSGLSRLAGKKVVLEVKQDLELIGGIVARIGDLVLDGSVKTQMMKMRESLKRGESV